MLPARKAVRLAEPKGEDPAPAGGIPEDEAPTHHVLAEEEPHETALKELSPEPDSFPADLEDLPDYDEELDSAIISEGEVTPQPPQDAVPAIDAIIFALLEKDTGDFTAQTVKDRVKSFEAMVKKKEEIKKAPLTEEERLKLASKWQ